MSDAVARVSRRAQRAVVAINGSNDEGEVAGSGFFIRLRRQPVILTNEHIVRSITSGLKVTLDSGAVQDAYVLGTDRLTDLAALAILGPWRHALRLRRAPARTGELCLAMGNPLGRYPQSVTFGIVSAPARTLPSETGRPHYHLVQIDCLVHDGNSGGPLVDARGAVIGINTILDAESGHIGLAIPAQTAAAVLPFLIRGEPIKRATLGIVVQSESSEPARRRPAGLRVIDVGRSGAKHFRRGDVLTHVGRRRVTRSNDLLAALNGDLIGRPTGVRILRGGRAIKVTVRPRLFKP